MQQNVGISPNLMMPVLAAFWFFCSVFIFCEFGENVCSEFDELKNAVCESDWYIFPIEVQRSLPFLLMVTQKQIVPRGFGNILCNRESFQTVIF